MPLVEGAGRPTALLLFLGAFDFSEVGGAETWAEGPGSEVGTSKSDPTAKSLHSQDLRGRQAPGSQFTP